MTIFCHRTNGDHDDDGHQSGTVGKKIFIQPLRNPFFTMRNGFSLFGSLISSSFFYLIFDLLTSGFYDDIVAHA